MPALIRLSAVLDSHDMPATARHLLDAIGELTAADFAAIRSGKERLPSLMSRGFDGAFHAAMARSLAERWLAVDEKGALDFLPDLAQKAQGGGVFDYGPLFSAMLAARPREALKTFLSMEPDDAGGPVSAAVQDVFAALAEQEPAEARAHLAECRDANQRKQAELGIALGISVNDPVGGAALAFQLGASAIFRAALASAESVGAGAVLQVVAKGNREFLDAYTLGRLVVQFPEAAWDTLPADLVQIPGGVEVRVIEAAQLLEPSKREGLLVRSKTFPGYLRTLVQSAVLSVWARENPPEATEWARQNLVVEKQADAAPLKQAFRNWFTEDRDAAETWWRALPASVARESLSAIAEPEAEKPGAPTGLEAAAQAMLAAEPPGRRPSSLSDTVRQWFEMDPEAAARWAQEQPRGDKRDRAFRVVAAAAATRDLDAAGEWLHGITDQKTRQLAARDILSALARTDVEAARKWISQLNDVHPLWKQWVLRPLR